MSQVATELENQVDQASEERAYFPEEAARTFTWDESFKKERANEQATRLNEFCKKTSETLNLDASKIISDLREVEELTNNVYKIIYPEGQGLPYHNEVHGALTASAGIEMYVQSLYDLAQSNPAFRELLQKDKSLAQKLVTTNIAAFNLHEIREWPLRGKDQATVDKVIDSINNGFGGENGKPKVKGLREMGVLMDDVDMIVRLDEFPETLQESLKVVGEMQPAENSIFSVDTNIRNSLLKESGACLRTADFLQTLNLRYLKQMKVVGLDTVPIELTLGPMILALEMKDVRPSSLPKDWIKNDQTENIQIDWVFVGVGSWMYEEKIKPNLDYAIKYMEEINPNAYKEIRKRQQTLESIVKKDEERKKKYSYLKTAA